MSDVNLIVQPFSLDSFVQGTTGSCLFVILTVEMVELLTEKHVMIITPQMLTNVMNFAQVMSMVGIAQAELAQLLILVGNNVEMGTSQ